jgi:REP element-mobilizing transposase RayT
MNTANSGFLTRLRALSEVFAIDICAYAIMPNHYHLVLRVNQTQAQAWTKTQVAERWGKLFNLPQIVSRYLHGETHVDAEAIQALLDEAAALTCMSYVDLNPVLAGIAETPEASDFTSIQQLIRQHNG